jgi:hypothetical protein
MERTKREEKQLVASLETRLSLALSLSGLLALAGLVVLQGTVGGRFDLDQASHLQVCEG